MERFIVNTAVACNSLCLYLKSSMERFIAGNEKKDTAAAKFKIQYGEIYRICPCLI